MKYVKSLDMFGVEAKEIPCTKGHGAPTTATEGAVGCLYMDTDTGVTYKCIAVADGKYTWKCTDQDMMDFTLDALGKTVTHTPQDLTDEQKAQARENIGAIQTEVAQTTGDSTTAVMSQKAVSDNLANTSNAIKKTVGGEVVQITDVSPVSHKVKVKFTDGNHNLCDLSTITPISKEQITIEGDTVRIKAGTSVYGIKMDGSILEVGKTYTFSVASVNCPVSSGWRFLYSDGTYEWLNNISTYKLKSTATIEKEVSKILFYISSPYTGTEDILLSYIDIQEGNEITHYRACNSKNLIPFPYYVKSGASNAGITATIQNDGGIVLNGTNATNAFFVLSEFRIDHEKNISSAIKYNYETNKSSRKFVANSSDGNVGLDSEITKWYVNQTDRIYLAVKPGTYINEIVYPQIEVGQQSTEYEMGEPYSRLSLDENCCCEIPSDFERITIWSNAAGVSAEAEYQLDLSKEIASLKPNARLEEYGLPILYIEGDTYAMSKEIEVPLRYRFGDKTGACTMKWQGSSSITWPKKNYTIKFDNKFEAKEGWGEQKKYCLKANYVDASHARNLACAKIWGDFVKSRTTPNEKLLSLPNGGAVDGFPIIMVLNGEFHGLYTFNIPKDKWMFGMGDNANEVILCADSNENSLGATAFKDEATLQAGVDFEIEYTADEDNTDWIKTSINRLINAVRNSDGTDIDTVISQYLDIDSAIDYYIFEVFAQGNDNGTRNYLLSTYDGVKWFFTGYDMDSTFGLAPINGFGYLSPIGYSYNFESYANMHLLMKLLKTHKKEAIKARYHQLKQYGYPLFDATKYAADFCESVPKSVYDKDYDKWRGIKYTSVNNYAQIAEFMHKRLAYMDEQVELL